MMKEMNMKEMEIANGGNSIEFRHVVRDFGDWFDETRNDIQKGLENTGKGLGFLLDTIWHRIF